MHLGFSLAFGHQDAEGFLSVKPSNFLGVGCKKPSRHEHPLRCISLALKVSGVHSAGGICSVKCGALAILACCKPHMNQGPWVAEYVCEHLLTSLDVCSTLEAKDAGQQMQAAKSLATRPPKSDCARERLSLTGNAEEPPLHSQPCQTQHAVSAFQLLGCTYYCL